MTLMKPAQGRWVDKGIEYPERVIPVRIMVEEKEKRDTLGNPYHEKSQIWSVIQFTLSHYRQKAVMYYAVSREVNIVFAKENLDTNRKVR